MARQIRDIEAKADRIGQKVMGVRVVCLIAGDPNNMCDIHPQISTSIINPDAITGQGYATASEISPVFLFNTSQGFVPNKKDVYLVSKTEGYEVEAIDNTDNETICVNCTRMTTDKMAKFAYLMGC